MKTAQTQFESKIGTLYLVASAAGLKGIYWSAQDEPFDDGASPATGILRQAEKELTEYLDGSRQKFSVALDPEGTDFQKLVWDQLAKIPYGETRSYKEIATALKDGNASRAVGTANGKNPLCIIIPCHRVINSNGDLGGYSGGLARKETLLALETKK